MYYFACCRNNCAREPICVLLSVNVYVKFNPIIVTVERDSHVTKTRLGNRVAPFKAALRIKRKESQY